ncbi:MAG: OmpA family protein [Bacteroidetes bacterium]|nr:OmpA family protein [Bacteroidota bacterium]
MYSYFPFLFFFTFVNMLFGCGANSTDQSVNVGTTIESQSFKNLTSEKIFKRNSSPIKRLRREIYPVRINHSVNTSKSEYHPAISNDGQTLAFTGMDRTGYFDNKIDFTKSRNAGGEDIFISKQLLGFWGDATSVKSINTNGHQAVSQLLPNGDLLLTGNYPENMGPTNDENGSTTTDLYLAKKNNDYQLFHFDEPINSIYSEFDGFIAADKSFILFSSDRPTENFNYHKKGWMWNESFWGNTDIYISLRDGDFWTEPKLMSFNTEFAERTPWISADGLTLFISSNGFSPGKKDLDIYFFTRKDKNDWDRWEGPFEIESLNGPTDEWGYQEDVSGNGFFARATKLNYTSTKKAKDGTGFVFENNFRSGYEVFGLQSGSFYANQQTDIYMVNRNNVAVLLPEILFEVNSYKLNAKFRAIGKNLMDIIEINAPSLIKIVGHCDSDGSEELNQTLSMNRANAVREFLLKQNPALKIEFSGVGSQKPIFPNTTLEGKQKNRRVEIYFN